MEEVTWSLPFPGVVCAEFWWVAGGVVGEWSGEVKEEGGVVEIFAGISSEKSSDFFFGIVLILHFHLHIRSVWSAFPCLLR